MKILFTLFFFPFFLCVKSPLCVKIAALKFLHTVFHISLFCFNAFLNWNLICFSFVYFFVRVPYGLIRLLLSILIKMTRACLRLQHSPGSYPKPKVILLHFGLKQNVLISGYLK